MELLRRSSIRTRLKLAILSTTFLSVVLVFAGFFVYEQITYHDALITDLSTKAEIIAENVDAALAFGNSADATHVLKSLATQPHIVAAAIYDHEGKLFAMFQREGGGGSIPPAPATEGARYVGDALVLNKPINLNSGHIGTIYLNMDLVGRNEHFRSYIEIGVLVLLGSLAVAFVVATMLERNISKPILHLAGTARQVSEWGDYSIRAEKVSDDETGFLADAVNQMLAQIQEGNDVLRRTNNAMAEEIAERKRAEAAIRESEGRFRNLVISLPVALYTTDREGRITLFNEPAAGLWGCLPEIGKDVWCGSGRMYLPDGTPLDPGESPMALSLRENRPIKNEEIVIERSDGTRASVLLHCEPLRDAAGKLTGAINMLVDITDRKLAEESLRRAHDELEIRVKERTVDLVRANDELRKRDVQLSTAQQIARLGSWEWDLQSSIVTWSEEMYRIYGRRHDEFGETFESSLHFVHPEDRPHALDRVQEAIWTREGFDFEKRILRPDGTIRILHSQGRVVTGEDGKVVRLLGICLDVTDRKRAEEKFRGLLESAPDAMIITRQDGRIVLVNAQTERLFGYPRSELLDQQVEILLPNRFRRVRNYFITASRLELDEGLELYGLRKDNTEFPVEVTLSPLETEDGMLVSSAIRDITEQQRLRSRLLAAERQRSADLRRYARSVQRVQEEERQRVARELHDDLCQRLSGMKLNVEVIADDVGAKDRGLRRRLQKFNKQCEEMIIEVRRMSANLRPVVLDDFGLVIALGLLTREFEKLHRIQVHLETDESARLQLDPQLEIALYRIAQEALTNVAKHARASRVTVALQKSDDAVLLRISDNGKGLNTDAIPRRDSTHGLGLIGMRERTGLMGGSFAIESTRKGTTITVSMPVNIGIKHEEDAPAYS